MRDENKHHKILQAAVKVFSEKGFYNSRVSEIAKEANVADGTIYLPPERTCYSPAASEHLQTIHVNPAELTPQRLEAILRAQTGQSVCLEPGTYRAMRISQIRDFTTTTLDSLQSAVASHVVFRGTAE